MEKQHSRKLDDRSPQKTKVSPPFKVWAQSRAPCVCVLSCTTLQFCVLLFLEPTLR
jgi:hypothetical protein